MSRDKQTEKVSKQRREYLKFKPFADDLRKAESWCKLDGVLNRYQTVKNLSKMGYRKASDVAEEIFEEIEASAKVKYWRGGGLVVFEVNGEEFAELKKKYTEGGE